MQTNNQRVIVVASVQTQTIGEDGFWKLHLPPQPASKIPIWIDINSTSGNVVRLENILFGDVYICGGQSNMVFSLPVNTNATKEIQRGNQYHHIRIFTLGTGTSSDVPLPDLQTIRQNWTVANETTLSSNNTRSMFTYFSSVCWFFGRTIADGLDNEIPIGLISNNWGGTKIEQWQPGGNLYNAMIHPYMIGPMALTGFAWYQGESNAHNPEEANKYSYHFPNMIQSWRHGFNSSDAFFGFVQLSTACHPPALPLLRQAQMKALDKLGGSKIAYATNADRGDGCNIHPPAKQDCGIRLGRSALAVQYGQSSIRWKSPSYSYSRQPTTTTSNDDGNNGTKLSIVIALQNVSPHGLYLIDVPFSIDPNRPSREHPKSRCEDLVPGTCAGAQLLLNNGKGWVNATIAITDTNEVTLTAVTMQEQLEEGVNDVASSTRIVATRYGFAQIPLLTIYDKGTSLPVLPWKEETKCRDGGPVSTSS